MGNRSLYNNFDIVRDDFKRFEQLFAQLYLGISIVGQDLHYLYVNERMAIIDDIPVAQHKGKTVYELDPQIAVALEPVLSRVIRESRPLVDYEIVVRKQLATKTYQNKYWSICCYPLRTEGSGVVLGYGLIVNDVTEQRAKEEAKSERLKFEALLSDLSSEFINVAVSDIDRKIEKGLQKVVKSLGFDRCSIWKLSPGDGRLLLSHSYALPGIKQPSPVIEDVIPTWIDIIRKGEVFKVADIDELPDGYWREKEYCKKMAIKSILFIPGRVGGTVVGTITCVANRVKSEWPDELIHRLRLLWEIFANALERKHAEQKIQTALIEIKQLKNRLEAENIYLRDQIDVEYRHDEIIGKSESIRKVLSQIEQVAKTDTTVLILGETGTGKELIARAIHNMSARKSRAMIKVNCAALPAALIEAELFGHEKGAYSGAISSRIGRFEAANGSTIFLDEIGELPIELQAKLLRVIQENQFERLGSSIPIKVDVRIIAATNKKLDQAVREGTFREDLYYRLNVFPISVPPLRERREDIPLLVWAIVEEFSKVFGKTIERIPKRNMELVELYHWPGNIRELRNLVERAMIIADGTSLVIDVQDNSTKMATRFMTIENMEQMHITAVLEKTGWRIRGRNGAAEILGLKPTTLHSRMKKLGIKRKIIQIEHI